MLRQLFLFSFLLTALPFAAAAQDGPKTYDEGTGELLVSTNVPYADVHVDGKFVGKVDAAGEGRFLVPSGVRQVMISKEGMNRSVQEVVIPEFYARNIMVDLVREVPGLVIRCNLPDCTVFIDGLEAGRAPLEYSSYEMGSHTIKVEREGYSTYERVVNLTAPEIYVIDVQLESAYGALEITSEPSGATVYLDGRNIGSTPLTMANAPTGGHSVRFQLEGYAESIQTVKVLPARGVRMAHTFRQGSGELHIKCRTAGAVIYLNGTPVGEGSVKLLTMEPGNYELRIRKEGYRDYYERITVEEEEKTKVNAGKLNLIGDRSGGSLLNRRTNQEPVRINTRALGGVLIGLGVTAGLATGGYFLTRNNGRVDEGPVVPVPDGVQQVVSMPMTNGRGGITIFRIP